MVRIGRPFHSFLALCPLLLLSGIARAEDPAAAEVLFQEGRRLLSEGQTSAACEKLKDSFALDPMSGTLLNLAACYEKLGKTATAWARFHNAASLAKSQGKVEQAAEANRQIKALEADLSYLTIAVSEPTPGLEVTREGLEITPATYGVQVPVDPGPIEIIASAPGHKTFKQTVEIAARRDKRTISIPKLDKLEKGEVAEAAEPAEAAAAAEKPPTKPKKEEDAVPVERKRAPEPPPMVQPEIVSDGPGKVPWIIGSLGLVAGATGGVFGYLAIQSNNDAKSLCPTRLNCAQPALDAADRRDRQAMYSNIGFGVGIAGVGTAAVWLLVGGPKNRDDDSASLIIHPSVSPNGTALWATGNF
jgi:serine/threonine-protein kinase